MSRRFDWQGKIRSAVIALAMCVMMSGCDQTPIVVYVNPKIELGDYTSELKVEGPPTVVIGYYIEQLFAPLEEGGHCFVAYGVQGGTWTMPAIRTTGIGSPVTVTCRLVMEDGEVVGEVTSDTPLFITPDGFLEIQAFPVPVQHAPPNEADPIDDLYGALGTLTCTVSDQEERADTLSILVELVED